MTKRAREEPSPLVCKGGKAHTASNPTAYNVKTHEQTQQHQRFELSNNNSIKNVSNLGWTDHTWPTPLVENYPWGYHSRDQLDNANRWISTSPGALVGVSCTSTAPSPGKSCSEIQYYPVIPRLQARASNSGSCIGHSPSTRTQTQQDVINKASIGTVVNFRLNARLASVTNGLALLFDEDMGFVV